MVTSDTFDETSRWTSEKWPRDVSDSDDSSLFGDDPMVRTSRWNCTALYLTPDMLQDVPAECTCIDEGGGGKVAAHSTSSVHSLARSLSLPPFSSDPWNHCCPTDLIHCQTHDTPRAVTPPLRKYEELAYKRVGEAIDLFRQLFEVVVTHWSQMSSVGSADACMAIGNGFLTQKLRRS